MRNTALFFTLIIATGCSSTRPPQKATARIDRAQQRSMGHEYTALLNSTANQLLSDNAAHNSAHARATAITLAKQVKQVETSKNLYSAVGLSGRTSRRLQIMLNEQKKKVADAAITPENFARSSKPL